MAGRPVVVLLAGAGAGWESPVLAAAQRRPDLVVLRRCVDVEDLLAATASGQADVAVVALDAVGLDLAAVDRLHRDGVAVVGVLPEGGALEQAREHAARIGLESVGLGDDVEGLIGAIVAAPGQRAARPTRAPHPTTGDAANRHRGEPDADRPADDQARPATTGRRVAEPRSAGSAPTADPTGDSTGDLTDDPFDDPTDAEASGRVLVVWGPAGAPGRTTTAVALSAAAAAAGRPTVLVDVDPYGGAVAQHLGVLEEVSGLLAASRLAAGGTLGVGVHGVVRGLGPGWSVVTGLPRPDRWSEVRPGTVTDLLEALRVVGDVVVDAGPGLEEDPYAELAGRAARDQTTLEALAVADEIVVVLGPDPVGLSRGARGLATLAEVTGGRPVRVVVNRMRTSLGWSERDILALVRGFPGVTEVHTVPDDRGAVDRALAAGRAVTDHDGAAARAFRAVAQELARREAVAVGQAANSR